MRCGREGPRPGLTGHPPAGNRGQRTSLPHRCNIGDGRGQGNLTDSGVQISATSAHGRPGRLVMPARGALRAHGLQTGFKIDVRIDCGTVTGVDREPKRSRVT